MSNSDLRQAVLDTLKSVDRPTHLIVGSEAAEAFGLPSAGAYELRGEEYVRVGDDAYDVIPRYEGN